MVIDFSGGEVPSFDGGEGEDDEDDRSVPGSDGAVRMLREFMTSGEYFHVHLDLACAKGIIHVAAPVLWFKLHGNTLIIDTVEETILLDASEIKVVIGQKCKGKKRSPGWLTRRSTRGAR